MTSGLTLFFDIWIDRDFWVKRRVRLSEKMVKSGTFGDWADPPTPYLPLGRFLEAAPGPMQGVTGLLLRDLRRLGGRTRGQLSSLVPSDMVRVLPAEPRTHTSLAMLALIVRKSYNPRRSDSCIDLAQTRPRPAIYVKICDVPLGFGSGTSA
jgi:hypothetical protein